MPTDIPGIAPGAVTVWQIALDRPLSPGEAATLSADDERDAARLNRPRAGDRLRVRRAAVRSILAAHLGVAAGDLAFGRTAYGRPVLAGAHAGCLGWSVARVGAVALCAVGTGEIGLDAEVRRELPDATALAERVLTAGERRAWLEHAPEHRSTALLAAWTRKEAVLKALGVGLAVPPDRVEVGWAPATDVAIHGAAGDTGHGATGDTGHAATGDAPLDVRDMRVVDVAVPAEVVAALATRGAPVVVTVRAWSPERAPAAPAR